MKIINSHYIPMPEPRWLIITPIGEIYDQIGTLSVVEEAPGKKGKYGIKTHNHPVVVSADKDTMQEKKDSYDQRNQPGEQFLPDDHEREGACWLKNSTENILQTLHFPRPTSRVFSSLIFLS